MDTDLLTFGFNLAFSVAFIAGASAWSLSTIIHFFKNLSGG